MPTIDDSFASWTSAIAKRHPADASLCESLRALLHGRKAPDLNWIAVGLHVRIDEALEEREIAGALREELELLLWAAALLGRDGVPKLRAPVQQVGDLLLLPQDQTARSAGQQLREVIYTLDDFRYDEATAQLIELERSLEEPIAGTLAQAIADCRSHIESKRR
jgi:hypothetical protein